MAELVSDCATLCDIQKTHGMTGVFKVRREIVDN